MRISDWSSTCAIPISEHHPHQLTLEIMQVAQLVRAARISVGGGGRGSRHGDEADAHQHEDHQQKHAVDRPEPAARSEEHTSELQSLMRISYAVFCLKKNTNKNTKISNIKTTQKIKNQKTN